MKPPGRRINNPSHEATWHNQNRDAIEDRTPKDSKDIIFRDVRGGFEALLRRDPPTGGGLDIRRMLILGVAEDYLTASEHPDTDGDGIFSTDFPNPVNIAKPPAFRVTRNISNLGEVDWVIDTGESFNTRHFGTVPGMVLSQWIYPPYLNGAEIYVLFGIKNGTGVIVDGVHLHAMDITPGRVWTDALQQVCVKIGTKKEQMKVRGSSPTVTP